MGPVWPKWENPYFKRDTYHASFVMVGLDGTGKTTILYKLKLNKTVPTQRTIGFNLEDVDPVGGPAITLWDVGGGDKHLWKHYYNAADGLIYVVDSADHERLVEAREELFGILDSDEMRGVPVVVLANKQDLPNSMSAQTIEDSFNLEKLTGRKWYVQGSCATTGEGIYEGLNILASMVKDSPRKR